MSNYLRLTCLLPLAALTLAAQTASFPAPVTETTAMIGLAQGQTAQLNLLNPGVLPPATGVVCTATVTFFDNSGAALKTGSVAVTPGKSGAVKLSGDTDITIAPGQRRDIRAQIAIPGLVPANSAAPSAASICKLVPTLEIYDDVSGRTLVSIAHVVQVASAVAGSN